MNSYKLFCLHLAGSIYESLTFQGPIIRRIKTHLRNRQIHPLLADEAQRLRDEAERSI